MHLGAQSGTSQQGLADEGRGAPHPETARPTRQVRPTIFPRRFRIAEILCSVPVK